MDKVDISELKGVTQTLLIPLMGRAFESQKKNGIIEDSKSKEIFKQIDYDFQGLKEKELRPSLFRTVIRTRIIDQLTQKYLAEYPSATIVEIGCGLNTRFERIDNGKLNWFDLDVPEVHRIWNMFFSETSRRHFLSNSAFDDLWMDQVKKRSDGPYFFISEASINYFPEQQIRPLFDKLHRHFPGSHYLFDSASPGFLSSQQKSSIARKYFSTHFKWFLKDPVSLQEWIPEIIISETVNLEQPGQPYADLYTQNFIPKENGEQLNLIRFGK